MSQTLILELSDQAYATLRRQADAAGTSAAEMAAISLEKQLAAANHLQKADAPRTEAEKQAARERFESHFGEVNLGYPTGVDNESIDADLAREYADNHGGD